MRVVAIHHSLGHQDGLCAGDGMVVALLFLLVSFFMLYRACGGSHRHFAWWFMHAGSGTVAKPLVLVSLDRRNGSRPCNEMQRTKTAYHNSGMSQRALCVSVYNK